MTDVEAVQRLYEGLGKVPDVVVNNIGAAACQAKLVDGDPAIWWGDYVCWIPTSSMQPVHLCFLYVESKQGYLMVMCVLLENLQHMEK